MEDKMSQKQAQDVRDNDEQNVDDGVEEIEQTETLKRRSEVTVSKLDEATSSTVTLKRHKYTYNFMAAEDINFPQHSRSFIAKSLCESVSCESLDKNRFYLTPVNEDFIMQPNRSRVSIRSTKDLSEVRTIGLKGNNLDISACRMIPGMSNAIAGDDRGNLYHLNLEKGSHQLIDCYTGRGGVLDIAFCTPNRFIVVGENKECSFHELEGTKVNTLSNDFEDSQLIRKITFLDENRFIAGESFHNLRIFDVELFKVSRKIPTEGSVYTMCRLDRNRFSYGGSTSEISHYDCRSGKVVMSFPTKQNWTGVIRHLSEHSLVYSDWRKIVLTDLRKGELSREQTKAKSGIWDAHMVNRQTLLTSSSDCHIVKMDIVC